MQVMRVPARFEKIEDIKKLFGDELVVGVGVTAFPRSGLAYILPNYKILSLFETSDLPAIREKCEVISVEKTLGGDQPEKFNTSGILELPEVKEFLQGYEPCNLFLYKASTVTDKIVGGYSAPKQEKLESKGHSPLAAINSLRLLSTPGHIRKVFENKKSFREDALKAGLKIPKGATLRIEEVTDEKWEEFKEKFGERLVFQLTDYTIGGGLGTFFIDSKKDLEKFREFVERRSEERILEYVNVTERIEGRQASVAGCATHYGTVACVLQNQIMDQPELAALVGRSGVWLGQDWNVRFSEKAQLLAEEQVKKWGEYIYKKGYKGIFGLDLMVGAEDEVYVIECNSRYTGAFPVLTMTQLKNKETPIDVWHLLEWFDIEYEMDVEEVQKACRQPKKAAQLLLHNLERKFVTPTRSVKAGVYKVVLKGSGGIRPLNNNKQVGSEGHSPPAAINGKSQGTFGVEWVREGFSLLDIKDESEFVLCDRVPTEDMVLKPAERLGRLVFSRKIVTDEGELLDWTRGVIKAVYDQFELSLVENPEA